MPGITDSIRRWLNGAASAIFGIDTTSGDPEPVNVTGNASHTRDTMNGDQFASGVLADGNPVIIPMAGARMGCVVWTEPVAGDTVTVKYSRDDGVTYYDWPRGPVTTGDADVLVGAITHLSFQRTAGAGTTSEYGVTR